ncbi:MAG: hypothetical protein AAGA48_07250 [Myxococcota bacterium]
MIRLARILLMGLGLIIASDALAGSVLLPPFTSDSSVNTKQRALVIETLASELELASGIDEVQLLQQRPSTLTTSCLGKVSCLSRIARNHAAKTLIAGTMRRRGRLFWLDLVYYDEQRIVRRKTFSVPTDPTGLGNAMGPVVRELLTGRTGASEEPTLAGDLDLDELDDFETDAADVDVANIQFGEPDQVGVEAIEFGSGSVETKPLDDEPDDETLNPLDDPMLTPEPQAPRRAQEREAAREQRQQERDAARMAREAERRQEERDASLSRTSPSGPPPAEAPSLQVTGRVGGAKYYQLNFVTAGAEVALRTVDGLYLIGGVEAYNVNRVLSLQRQQETGRLRGWDQIYPIHLGVLYKFGDQAVRPYVGLEVIFAQYYQDEIGADWAAGPRARGGVDWMIARNFGLNANVALGGWLGQNWPFIEDGLQTTGLLPQLSVGPILSL